MLCSTQHYTTLHSWIERPVNRKERLYHGLYLGYILAHFIRFLETLQILCFIERTYRLCIISPSHIPQNTLQQYFKCCDLSFNRQICYLLNFFVGILCFFFYVLDNSTQFFMNTLYRAQSKKHADTLILSLQLGLRRG